jgi:hypothetical protein
MDYRVIDSRATPATARRIDPGLNQGSEFFSARLKFPVTGNFNAELNDAEPQLKS